MGKGFLTGKIDELGPNDFDKLLAWLDPDRDRAAIKYEEIRRRLIKILVSKGCWEAEDLADEVMDRVSERADEIAKTHEGDPAKYFGGVARNVYREWLRRQERLQPAFPAPPEPDAHGEGESGLAPLEERLGRLQEEDREIILEYYKDDGQARINHRRELAKRKGLEIDALRLRVHRIRKILRDVALDRIALHSRYTANPPGRSQRQEALTAPAPDRNAPLGSLLDRLGQLDLEDRDWIAGICSSPVEAVVGFQGADSMESFCVENRLDQKFEREWKMQVLEDLAQDVDLDRVSIVALYPSGALRSIPARLSREDNTLKVQI
jgi:DNA-directed RNA polymerase specialized sigma24 family protein